MDPKLLTLLIAALALNTTPTDDQAIAHLRGMDDIKRAQLAEAYGEGGAEKIAALLKATPSARPVAPAQQASADDDVDAQFVLLEKKRVTGINQLADIVCLGAPENAKAAVKNAALTAVSKNMNLAQARQEMQAALATAVGPVTGTDGTQSLQVGNDLAIASLHESLPQAIFLKANQDINEPVAALNRYEQRVKENPPVRQPATMLGKVHERALSLRHLSLVNMYKAYLQSRGIPRETVENVTPAELAEAIMSGGRSGLLHSRLRGHVALLAESTSDFANITLDAIHKSMRFFYLDAPKTWDKWLQRQTNSDFKNINRIALSESPSMVSADEGAPIQYVVLGDSKETYVLKEYKGGIKLTRRAIINDDMGAFGAIPRLQANTAVRLEEDTAYGLLTNGLSTSAPYAMGDGYALFDNTNHANYTSSGTAISIASLQVAWNAIFTQKGPKSAAFLELQPKFLLVPSSIYWAARELIDSPQVFPVTGATPNPTGTSNPFNKMFQVIPSSRLNAASATSWYLGCDYRDGQINTGELCFLESEPEPVLRMETDFDTEDVKYAVRHTVAGKMIDYRAWYKNAGA